MSEKIKLNAIYTYKNPFELEQLPEWSELKKYPHLCISQTLVEGLKEYYGRSAFQLLCTVDVVLKKFYEEWYDSPENNINQSTIISNLLDDWKRDASKDQKLIRTIEHNSKDFILALRMLIESNVSLEEVQQDLSEEQALLLEAYRTVEKRKEFSYLKENKKKRHLDEAYLEVLKDEIKKYLRHYKGDKRLLSHTQLIRELDKAKEDLKVEIGRCRKALDQGKFDQEDEKDRMVMRKERGQKKYNSLSHIKSIFERYQEYETIDINTDKVVLHGIHQFSPLILRFIEALNSMGVEVIALFNYMSDYPEIYKTWKTVYSWSDLPFIERGNMYLSRRKLGEAIGKVYERDFSAIEDFKEHYYMFDHLTSFSDYVGDRYQEAVKEYERTFKLKKKGDTKAQAGVENEKLIKIALMNEQFYAINGSEINELLKVYFPEQFSSRHFLTYPVGQFILSLYKMWDDDANNGEGDIKIKKEHIKEALALDIWRQDGMPTPIDMFNNLECYFRNEMTFDGYRRGLNKLKNVAKKAVDQRIHRMSFFIYTEEELDYFDKVIYDIRRIAEQIFKSNRDNLKENFQRLIEGIQSLITNPHAEERVTNDELVMLNRIQARLENLEDSNETTYVSTIKKTLGYYIEASTSKEYEAEWIVRDFEQIDGGILLAEAQKRDQKEKANEKIFHYAGVSDENLLGRVKKELPWPLTTKLYDSLGSKIASICATCRSEYNYFLRYSLFYGIYFLTDNKQICMSYIKEMGDKEAHPYSVLAHIMNLKVEDYIEKKLISTWDEELFYEDKDEQLLLEPPAVGSEKRSMETCFMRYLWNHCLDKDTYFYDEFQLERVAKFFIEYGYLNSVYNPHKSEAFNEAQFKRFVNYIPIFDGTDCKEVKASIEAKLNEKEAYKRKHGQEYIDNVMEFIYRHWNGLNKSVDEMLPEFKMWLMENGTYEWIANCKDCNQRKICNVIVEDKENID